MNLNVLFTLQTGDEMSKRSKFVFVTWVGPTVSVMKKAKMSTDKALMKDIIQVKTNNSNLNSNQSSHFFSSAKLFQNTKAFFIYFFHYFIDITSI